MTDVRELCKIFLDFVYDNDILPAEIVKILKETNNGDSEWDFRLICKLLQFKESYQNPRPGGTEEKLALNARFLQNVNVWRDTTSLRHLESLWKAANEFFHNVSTTDPVFKVALEDLIQKSQIPDANKYTRRMKCDAQENAKPAPVVPPVIKTYKKSDTTEADFGRAAHRIPKWAQHPTRLNHIIMWAFFKAASIDGETYVTKEFMQALCQQKGMTEKQFNTNYNSMKTDGGNAHGKVFVEIGPYVHLWEYIKPVALQYKSYFLDEQ